MIFNGIEKDYVIVTRGRDRPFFESEEGREVVVPVYIKYDSISHYQKLKEEIAFWLKHDEPKKLEFKDDNDRLYLAKLENIDQGEDFNYGAEAIITFTCDSKYSQERTINISNSLTQSIAGHTSTSWTTKTTFTSNQSSYELKFNSPSKSDLRDINKIKLNYNFIPGDILEIDYSKRKAVLNGNDITNTLVILQSNFKELPIGNVEFVCSVKTDLFYNERYY